MQVLLFILGLVIGSFFNVVIHRWSKGESIKDPWYSRCPVCKNRLKWYHNIPIISYLLLKGRCAYCQSPISIRYPLVELLTGFILLWCYFKVKPIFGWEGFVVLSTFSLVLIPISFIDLEIKEIPDALSLFLIFSGWFFSLIGINPLISGEISLVSGCAGIGMLFLINEIYYLITKRDGMGMGDFKLMGGIGAYLGYKSFYYVILIASITGILGYIAILLLFKAKGEKADFDSKAQIPFGPFLALGSLIYIFIWI